ncbi:MAG: bifunctional transaldolase/phosoglucose isomerase [Candidatus Rokubacteria bacterium]|nr:bifunctional transaldolase/phosoglucose isomerase [Candidatus Rokubacteria bacterium]
MALIDLRQYGQSVWYDFMSRHLLASGELLRLIARDGLAGVTSNPTILEQAVNKTDAYDEEIALIARRRMPTGEIYTRVVTEDIAEAADILHTVYEATQTGDGYVSLEVSPTLAHDADGTVAEALALWKRLKRANVMIKVPGTAAGFTAVRRLIAEGVNVNITLLFSQADYEAAARAYIDGLKDRLAKGGDIKRVASVASFFVSRIDTAVDKELDRLSAAAREPETKQRLDALKGKAAIANAKLAYQRFQDIFTSEEFRALEAQGARRQRPLWASTGTKNPKYSDVLYIEELVGPDTVNTMPPGALAAFRDHGRARPTIEQDVAGARRVFAELGAVGVDMNAIYGRLKTEGLQAFEDSFDALMLGIDTKRKAALLRAGYEIAGAKLGRELDRYNVELQLAGFVEGVWAKRPDLWSEDPAEQKRIANRLGWLESPELMAKNLARLKRFAGGVRADGIRHVVLLGMGGSSLAPEVMRAVLGVERGFPAFTMLDSTDPGAVRAVERSVPMRETLFIVASKSGTTVEPNALAAHFKSCLEAAGVAQPARHLVAITDEGTALHEQALHDGYREVFVNPADIGGRYSALSFFGMVPAALMGIDVSALLAWGRGMALLCGPTGAIAQNPGVALGIAMGSAARAGRDKLTLITGPRLRPFGLWIEQLIAESTGKRGTGIVPVAGEPLGPPEVYGNDRLFVRLRLHGGDVDEHERDGKVERLRAAGHPIVNIRLVNAMAIGAEFVRWEIATATAGAILGINPFDEPNVQQAKDATKALLARHAAEGRLPIAPAQLTVDGTSLTFDRVVIDKLGDLATDPGRALRAFLDLANPGDYLGLLAYLPLDPGLEERLGRLRTAIRDRKRVATMLGFGPRYLHSTGQLHKGGANSGVFILFTADRKEDVAIPGERFSFGVLELAQALGDFMSLEATGRRALRINLPAPDPAALDRACRLLEAALGS